MNLFIVNPGLFGFFTPDGSFKEHEPKHTSIVTLPFLLIMDDYMAKISTVLINESSYNM